MSEFLDGQIYTWKWADPKRDADSGPYRSYHCKSQIAVVKGGLLIDTFWGDMTPDRSVDPDAVIATLVADQSWEKISAWNVPYYAPSDVVDTRHSNNGLAPIYLRPGAVRSHDAIIAEIEKREESARSDIRSAQRQLDWLSAERAKLSAGRIDEVSL